MSGTKGLGDKQQLLLQFFFFGEGGYVHTFPCNSVFPHHVQSLDGGQEPLEGPPLLGLQLCRQLW